MSVTQTVDIPESRRLTIDVPREVPMGRTVLTFTAAEDTPAYSTEAVSNLDAALDKIWELCKDSPITVDSFLEMRHKDNGMEENQCRQFFTGSSS